MSRRDTTKPSIGIPTVPRRVCPACDGLVDERICSADGAATLSLDAAPSDPVRLQAGVVIGERYRVERLIGNGGFAQVFAATHTGTGQRVALKVLDGSGLGDDENTLRRFVREARASASLRHPNTVRVFDFGQEEDGTVYLAMELLTGRTLRAEQERRHAAKNELTEEEALTIAVAVAQSLSEAHCMGLVHRDIGPNNIFLHEVVGSDPVVKVLDFGLVKDGGKPLTKVNQLIGTPAFMSPEHVLGRKVDARSDCYGLGITMWWMVTGVAPFQAGSPREVMRRQVSERLPPLAEYARTPVSNAFEKIVLRMTAKDPDDRFADPQSLRRALEECLDEAKERQRQPTLIGTVELPPPARSRWKGPALIGIGTTALLALLLLGRPLAQPKAVAPPTAAAPVPREVAPATEAALDVQARRPVPPRARLVPSSGSRKSPRLKTKVRPSEPPPNPIDAVLKKRI